MTDVHKYSKALQRNSGLLHLRIVGYFILPLLFKKFILLAQRIFPPKETEVF